MLRIFVMTVAIMLATASAVAAACIQTPPPSLDLVVTVDTSACGQITVTATGWPLSLDSAFQIVAGNATKLTRVTHRIDAGGTPQAVAIFTLAEFGTESGGAILRTRYGGYLKSFSQQSEATPFAASEFVRYAVRACGVAQG